MNPESLQLAIDFMRDHWHLITDDESRFKSEYASRVAAVRQDAEHRKATWREVLEKEAKGATKLLGWRTLDALLRLDAEHPGLLQEAITALYRDGDADDYAGALMRTVAPQAWSEQFKNLRSVGSRASVASFFLFLRDHEHQPLFRAANFGTPLVQITGEPLDRRSPGTLLRDYVRGVDLVLKALQAAGLPARSRLDAQGVLWVVHYKKVLRPVS